MGKVSQWGTSSTIGKMIKSRRLRWKVSEARIKEGRRSAFKILIVKPTGKRTLGRPRRRWEDNTGIDL